MKLKLGNSVQEIDLIVFDCDGVLLDTMPAKIEAFSRWVPEHHAKHRKAFMERIMNGFGQSRYRHIEFFYRHIVGLSLQPELIRVEVARFTEICEPMCAAADWCEGSKEFVEACVQSGVIRFVLSGTPQEPLEAMLGSNGGLELFDEVMGSPPAKPERMERIIEETGVKPERCVFIGDANADYQAAKHVGAHFVYFPSEAAPPEEDPETKVRDLRELLVEKIL